MKNILTGCLTLCCFVFMWILPVFLWLHAGMMSHHGMSVEECIEHCMGAEAQIDTPKIFFLSSSVELVVLKIIFTRVFEYALPLVLLYLVLIHAPPNLAHKIKNYNYSSLVGIVKLTT